ncbi:MAG: hypothetical protein KAR42_14280 [candidate division Zixibacteria bacterium]|nr:hypothetical protein [candidate division Zixibacteria bacterium]
MCPDGISWTAITLAYLSIVLYSYGEVCRSQYKDYLKNIGIGGVGLVLLYQFFTSCPAIAAQMAIPLLIFAVIMKIAFWALYKYVLRQ